MNRSQPIPVPQNSILFSPSSQKFSLPLTFIHYVGKYSKSLELCKTCKYFCVKYPIIAVHHLRFSSLWFSKWRVICPENINMALYEIDPSTFKYKLWITEEFDIYIHNGINPNITSDLCQKLFQCDVTKLLIQDQIISYKEFLLLTTSKKFNRVSIEKTIVKNSDGSFVQPEVIFARCPNVKKFIYEYPDDAVISQSTAKAFTKFLQFKNLELFTFLNIPEGFDFEIFTKFIKKNPQVRCQLRFSKNLSESYIAKLNNYVENIIKSNATPPPKLRFKGQIKGTYQTLWIMQNRFFPFNFFLKISAYLFCNIFYFVFYLYINMIS